MRSSGNWFNYTRQEGENFVQIGDAKALHFTTVIDSYVEPEVEPPPENDIDEAYWVENFPGVLECARWYRNLLADFYGEIPTKYFSGYIALTVGKIQRVWVSRRKNDRALIAVKYVEEEMTDATDHLNKQGISPVVKNNVLHFNVDLQQLKDQAAVHEWIVQRLAPQRLANSKGEQAASRGG